MIKPARTHLNAVSCRPLAWLSAATLTLAGSWVLMGTGRPYAAAEALVAGQGALAVALVSWVRGDQS